MKVKEIDALTRMTEEKLMRIAQFGSERLSGIQGHAVAHATYPSC